MNPEEQPKSEPDLFKWGEEHPNPQSKSDQIPPDEALKKDDNLGWECPQCELEGKECRVCSSKRIIEKSNPLNIDEVNKMLQITGHHPKPSDEIPLEEAIAMMNETLEKIRGNDKKVS